ncbi:helix-turn-helix domain-containing protein [Streptomyces sp. NPDC057638]|uniref:helix-turn-helix domain-containing protein n=1 Tax=Streptomyces sp. NPDC057638 TaxID=3346190 RepID=UPI0036D1E78C
MDNRFAVTAAGHASGWEALHRSREYVGRPVDTRSAAMDAGGSELLHRVEASIDRYLADPRLSPRTLAARHHISIRTLYALFDGRDRSVAASIRHRRLERCRAELLHSTRPIGEIAARWGFASPTVFSRAFREVYGTTPSAFRRMARSAVDTPGERPAWAPTPRRSSGPDREDDHSARPESVVRCDHGGAAGAHIGAAERTGPVSVPSRAARTACGTDGCGCAATAPL